MGPSGCGYAFRNSRNTLFTKENIRKIYVSSLVNSTYKAGIEHTVYNSLIRILSGYRGIVLVSEPSDADAILTGSVNAATYTGSASSSVAGLNPVDLANQLNLESRSFAISTEYMATLSCSFYLSRPKPLYFGQPTGLWSAGFSRTQPFPAANQLDVPGATSALINESEFDRTLSDLSRKMVDDVSESMLAMF